MSSSTVSITPNPTGGSLRRPAEKKIGSDGFDASPTIGGDTTRGKGPIRPIKPGTETTVLERSGDTDQKIETTTKLRKRTVAKKVTSKPAWKTAVSVIVKNLGILVILLLLVQMIRRLGFNQGSGFDSVLNPVLANSDHERRITEVEKFMKTTTKMIQAQVEVVDRKIENEIAGLKSEFSKRIDDRVEFSSKISKLDGRVNSVENLLSGNEWLSRDDFDKFVDEFLGKKKGEMKLDEIRVFAKEIVEKEIEKHAADGLGRVDYAVATGGASVLKHSEAFNGGSRISSWLTGSVKSDAVKMLQPSFGQPGECFPLKGDNGFVEIKLRTAIVAEAITLEHVSKSVAFDRSSAPKDCKVVGWLRNEEDTRKEHLLTEFTYDLEKSSAQTFNVLDTEVSNPTIIDTVRLEFMSNHGSPTHTCIYRVRVHGRDAND